MILKSFHYFAQKIWFRGEIRKGQNQIGCMFTVRNTRSKRHRQGYRLSVNTRHQKEKCVNKGTQKLLLIFLNLEWQNRSFLYGSDFMHRACYQHLLFYWLVMIVLNECGFYIIDIFITVHINAGLGDDCFTSTDLKWLCFLLHAHSLTVTHSMNFPGILFCMLTVNAILWITPATVVGGEQEANRISRAKLSKKLWFCETIKWIRLGQAWQNH